MGGHRPVRWKDIKAKLRFLEEEEILLLNQVSALSDFAACCLICRFLNWLFKSLSVCLPIFYLSSIHLSHFLSIIYLCLSINHLSISSVSIIYLSIIHLSIKIMFYVFWFVLWSRNLCSCCSYAHASGLSLLSGWFELFFPLRIFSFIRVYSA